MFDQPDGGIGRWPGEGPEDWEAEERLIYELTREAEAEEWEEETRHLLPPGFETLPPLFLAAVVSSVDRKKLNGNDVVRLMGAEHRLASGFEAEMLSSIAEVAHCPPGDPDSPVERSDNAYEYAAAEVATALTWTRRRSERMVDYALTLREKLPRVWELMAEGLISSEKARVFVRILGHHSDELINAVLDRTLDMADRLTTGQLNARVSRCALEADPDASKHAFAQGLEDRRITAHQNPDMTGTISIQSGDPTDVARAMTNVETLARILRALPGESRSLDQIRHDVAMDLLKGKTLDGSNAKGRVFVTVPAATLEGVPQPGIIDGFGPIPAEIARKLAMDQVEGDWEYVVTDNGQPVATGTLARRPSVAQQRRVRALYPTCVFPGCRRPAVNSDLDHTKEWSRGGRTCVDNLAPLCRHHHRLRHDSEWSYRRLENGDHEWTSPLGHTYLRERDPPD